MGIVSVLALAAVIGAVTFQDRLLRLYNVLTLFDETRITRNFSSMDQLFESTKIPRAGGVRDLPERAAALPQHYRFAGRSRSIADWLEQTRTTSLLVLRDGAIVHERYLLGTGREDRRISWSMAKSFLSALFGPVLADGRIRGLDDVVTRYVPALAGTAYDGVTIRQVLQMASGVKFNEDYLDFNSDINRMGRVLALGGSMDAFAAGLRERIRQPGVARQYTSIDTHVIGMVLRAATGKSLATLMHETLWSRLGVEDDAVYLTDGFGVAFALGGLNLRTRDYARFGQLMLDHGRVGGAQLVPAAWIDEAVRNSAPVAAAPGSAFGYGYQWWVPPSADEGEFFAIGVYGQYLYVNRKARVVIVKTSSHRGFRNDGARGERIRLETIAMFREIAGALSDWAVPETPDWRPPGAR
ncbi:MAG: serine hydrolase [Burkholderiaceae bacterium]